MNQTTATIRLKAFFPNKDRSLWPNEFVKTRLLLSTRRGALVVPRRGPASSARAQRDDAPPYIVNPDDTVAMRQVDLISTQGDDAIIEKGLEAGEKVVTDGQNQLKPGAKIASRSPDSKAPPAASAGYASPPPSATAPPVPSGSTAKPAGAAP